MAQREKLDRLSAAMAGVAGLLAVALAYLVWAVATDGDGAHGPASVLATAAGKAGRARPSLPERPGADRTLAGTVVDGLGHPVADAEISAQLELGPGEDGAAPAGGLELQPAVEAQSGADGSFALVGLEPGRHRLRVSGRGVVTAEVRFVDVPGPAVRILVARAVAITGQVSDGGKPVVAEVVLDGPAGRTELASDGQGGFEFADQAEGVFVLWAYRGDRASAAVRLERRGAGPFAPSPLVLEPAAIVSGRVVDDQTGRGVAADVTLAPVEGDAPVRRGTSAADGGFRIEGVPLGRWTAAALAPGYVAADAVSFAAGGPSPVVRLRRGAIVTGVVVSAAGVPVRGALVHPSMADGGRAAATLGSLVAAGEAATRLTGLRFLPHGELGVLVGPIPYPPPPGAALRVAAPVAADQPAPIASDPSLESRLLTDAQGSFRLVGLPAGRYRVAASHPAFADGASAEVTVGLGDEIALRIVMPAGVTIVGQVVDDHGVALGGAVIACDSGGASRHAVADPAGRYRVGPVAGAVHLVFAAPGCGEVSRDLVLAGAADGEREEDVVLPRADAEVAGRVVDRSGFALGGATIAARAPGRAAAEHLATADGGGHFRVTGLVAGTYQLRVSHPDVPDLVTTAETGREVDLVAPFGGGLAGRIEDGDSGVGLAGVALVARGPDDARLELASGDAGGFRLTRLGAGHWVLSAHPPGYAAAELAIDVPAGDRAGQLTVADQTLALRRGATLAGTVRDGRGDRVAGATVAVGAAEAVTDADGHFRLTDAPSGRVTVAVSKADQHGELALTVAPGDEVLTLELRLE